MKTLANINKALLITFISLIVICFGVNAQQSNEENDKILLNIKNKIPSNWNYIRTSSRIHLIRSDSVFILKENRINAPKESRDNLDERIKKYGQLGASKIIYRYEPRWSKEVLKNAYNSNSKISKEIKKLPQKYNIEHLYNKSLSTKKNIIYTPTNEAEKNRIKQYEIEYNELSSKLITVPTLHTENFSLFIDDVQGCNDNNQVIFPETASIEVYSIMVLVSELCDK